MRRCSLPVAQAIHAAPLTALSDKRDSFPYYTTSLWAEALRLGDEQLLALLRKYDADWEVRPDCYQNKAGCQIIGSLAGWMFYMPSRGFSGGLWSVDEAIAAFDRLSAYYSDEERSILYVDPFFRAAIAYQKYLWTDNDTRVETLWQAADRPRLIVPYGVRSELSEPAKMVGVRKYKNIINICVTRFFRASR